MNTNKDTKKVRYQKRLKGIAQDLGNPPSIVLNGASYTLAQLQQPYKDWLDRQDTVEAKYQDYREALKARDAVGKPIGPLDRALRKYLEGTYGEGCQQLADCGFDATVIHKKTAAEKAQAAVKAKATRAARHTLGKRQKAGIKGTEPAPAPQPQGSGVSGGTNGAEPTTGK